LILNNSTDVMPIVSSLIGQPYDEENFDKITSALRGVSGDNVKKVLQAENSLWLDSLLNEE
jgi:hypothetical protein